MRRVPAEREPGPAEHGAHRKGDRQVQHDREPRGDGAVVDARAVPHGDRHVADHLAVRRDDHVADRVRHAAVVGDRVLLAGERVTVRMPGERPAERAVERVVALLLQVGGEFHREAARLDQGEGPTADLDHVGVDGVVASPTWAGRRVPAERRRRQARPDPAVAVPQGAAVLERDAVDHAVAEEPVVAGVGLDRVGAHLEVAPAQPRRDRPGDGQVVERQLRGHRLVDADDVGHLGRRQTLAVPGGDPFDRALGDGADGRCNGFRHGSRSPAPVQS